METERRDFTFFGKFANVLDEVPEKNKRGELALAAIYYGTDGVEPDFEFPYSAIFAGIKDDIDNSLAARENGKKGGRPRKKTGDKTQVNNSETGVKTTISENENQGSNPLHSNPNHKEKINKKENFGEEKTGASPTKPDGPRCNLCGSELKRRPVFGSDKQVYVCLHGHVCDAQGRAKNQPRGQE